MFSELEELRARLEDALSMDNFIEAYMYGSVAKHCSAPLTSPSCSLARRSEDESCLFTAATHADTPMIKEVLEQARGVWVGVGRGQAVKALDTAAEALL